MVGFIYASPDYFMRLFFQIDKPGWNLCTVYRPIQCLSLKRKRSFHALYLRRCSPEKFFAKQMVLKIVSRTYMGMQKSKVQNPIMCPLRGLVQHRPKNPPNLGRMGCLCQLLSPKGHMIWFLFFHYTFPVAKWVRKYPPCALHKTFLVRCLRKYSV